MDPNKRELLDLIVRWIHLIAGIMWVGNSMLFNWLDRSLEKKAGRGDRHVGEIWLLHSGGFYQVEKKFLAPNEMPEILHWFKWQAYTTWITGFLLLGLVYYMGGGAYLVDSASGVSPQKGTLIGLGILGGGFLVYDLLWRSPIAKTAEPLAQLLTFAIIGGGMYVAFHNLSGRAAYIHSGAMLGTFMAGNVFFHIIPSQHELIAATKEGREQDLAVSHRAKQRSIHNNYFTFPVLFVMVSNHFAITYGSRYSATILVILMIAGATVRHFLNIRFHFGEWKVGLFGTILVTVLLLLALTRPAPATAKVPTYNEVYAVLQERCVPCHAEHPTDPSLNAPPKGIVFDTPEHVKQHAMNIYSQAVASRAMPLGNKTRITEEERGAIGAWVREGAKIE